MIGYIVQLFINVVIKIVFLKFMYIKDILIKTLLMLSIATSQYYQVGDQVQNFGAPICMNGNGNDIWSYEQNGINKVIFLSIFATW